MKQFTVNNAVILLVKNDFKYDSEFNFPSDLKDKKYLKDDNIRFKSKKIVDYQFDKVKISKEWIEKLQNINYKSFGFKIR